MTAHADRASRSEFSVGGRADHGFHITGYANRRDAPRPCKSGIPTGCANGYATGCLYQGASNMIPNHQSHFYPFFAPDFLRCAACAVTHSKIKIYDTTESFSKARVFEKGRSFGRRTHHRFSFPHARAGLCAAALGRLGRDA